MPYISVAEAARLAGVSVRTVQRWIVSGLLPARHTDRRGLAVLDGDIAFLVSQRPARAPSAIDALAGRVEALEARVASLERQIADMTHTAPGALPRNLPAPSVRHAESETAAPGALPDDLPAGAILAAHFARLHGINPRTFNDQIRAGLVAAIQVRGKWYLTPEQQVQLRRDRGLE